MVEAQGSARTTWMVTPWEAGTGAKNTFPPHLQLPLYCQTRSVHLDWPVECIVEGFMTMVRAGRDRWPEQSKRTAELHQGSGWGKRTRAVQRPVRRVLWFLRIFCCVKKEREKGDSLFCPRSGVSQISTAGVQDDQHWWSQKDKVSKLLIGAGTCGLWYHLVHNFYIWECANYWRNLLCVSHFGFKPHVPTLFVLPRRKWSRARQSCHSYYTPLGAAYAMKQLHSRTLE